MCRGLFISQGKKVLHKFDYIYGKSGLNTELKKPPTISERQQNRKMLKNKMLKEIWGEDMKIENETAFVLNLTDTVTEKLEDRLILIKDINQVLKHAEETGRVFVNPDNGHLLSCRNYQNVTYWVEYVKDDKGFTIFNAYSHRMEIQEE